MKGYYITSLRNIEIQERIVGLDIGNGLRLYSRLSDVNPKPSRFFYDSVGFLESSYIESSKAIIIKEIEAEDPNEIFNTEIRLIDHLNSYISYLCQILWIIKDNSVSIENGFIEFPNTMPLSRVSSNIVYGNFFSSTGEASPTYFSLSELNLAVKLMGFFVCGQNQALNFVAPSDKAAQEMSRIERSFLFLRRARNTDDLAVRLSEKCILLECLFSSDTQEVSHKISERAAFFWSDNLEDRIKIFRTIKKAYSIRSRFMHGDKIGNKDMKELNETSQRIDLLLRRIYKKFSEKESLFEIFSQESNTDFEEFWLKAILSGNAF